MKFSQAGKMAFSAVLSNKLRSFLTMLGIIIGVLAVVVLISLVQGASNSVTSQLADLGGNNLIVQVNGSNRKLNLTEVRALEEEESIQYVSPILQGSGSAVAGSNSYDVTITGITERYDEVQSLDLENGRNINRTDMDYRLGVIILGHKVAEELFGTVNCLEQTVRLNGYDYRVVGVAEEKQDTMAGSVNKSVYIPYTNAQRLLKQTAVSMFYASAASDEMRDTAIRTLKDKMREKFDNEDAFTVMNMADVMSIIDNVMGALEMLMGAIAGISLLVGGIGIMNIMLVSVTERTREIGIRKAIGAQKADIIVQFLIESVIIAITGGLIGMAISWAILNGLNNAFPDYHFAITQGVATIALGFSAAVGIIFGIYPAAKAAQLKPINALRYE